MSKLPEMIIPEGATPRAIQACAVAMVHFRAFGWLEADIPELERIWWTLHDKEGNQI